MLADILFLMFAGILLLGACGVIMAKNPMHCILFMILCFFNASGIFILLGAEFLGLLLIMVYVGAIAVMFLFVLMTIDIDFAVLKEGFAHYLPVGVLIAGTLLAELVIATQSGLFAPKVVTPQLVLNTDMTNTETLGNILFTNYVLPFQGAGLILLTAMIGAIVLAHRQREGVRRQNVNKQISRTVEDAIKLTQPRVGKGVKATHWQPKSVEK